MSAYGFQKLDRTAYGELSVADLTSVDQFTAAYGIINATMITTEGGSGTVSASNALFTLGSGTDSDGIATLTSRRYVNYLSGQGLQSLTSATFPDPSTTNYLTGTGLITAENAFLFGMYNGAFGIMHLKSGQTEYQELTITTAATGSETATVTVDGTGYSAPITAGTAQDNAYEIAEALNGTVPNYIITSNDDQVLAQSVLPVAGGSFAFSSSTAVASWTQVTAGSDFTVDFTAQADWNGEAISGLDPEKGNIYKIQAQYLGFGNIFFSIEDPNTGRMKIVHQIKWTNANTTPSATTSSYRAGWVAQNRGNTTNVEVKGSGAAQFIEGRARITGAIFSKENNQTGVGTNLTNIISIRNRSHFSGNINRVEIYPRVITAATDSSKTGVFKLILNPTFATTNLDWQYISSTNSVAEYATDAATVSGGQEIGTVVIKSGSPAYITLNDSLRSDTVLQAGQTLCIAAKVTSGAASEMDASISWQEDT